MEINNILADKMIQLGIGLFSEVFIKIEIGTALAEVLKACQVAYGCIQPNIEVFVISAGNAEAEIRLIAGNIPVF